MTFGPLKRDTVARSAFVFFEVPEEIGNIRRGAYHEYVGFFVNEGGAMWLAFDYDRDEAVLVERYSGSHLEWVPRELPQGSVLIRRGNETVDVVTRTQVGREQRAVLVSLANELWASPPLLPYPATDMHNAIVLVDGETKKILGGPGLLPAGEAEALGRELRALFSTEDCEQTIP